MKIMTEVTVEAEGGETDSSEEVSEEGAVGQFLAGEGDTSSRDSWARLVRKLSSKRRRSRRRRRQDGEDVVEVEAEDEADAEEDEDDVPDDWKPDFIPKHRSHSCPQPDVVPTNLPEEDDCSGHEDTEAEAGRDGMHEVHGLTEDQLKITRQRSNKR